MLPIHRHHRSRQRAAGHVVGVAVVLLLLLLLPGGAEAATTINNLACPPAELHVNAGPELNGLWQTYKILPFTYILADGDYTLTTSIVVTPGMWACFVGGGSDKVRITGGGEWAGAFGARGRLGLKGLTLAGPHGASVYGLDGYLTVEDVTFTGGVIGRGALDILDGGRAVVSNSVFAGASREPPSDPGAAVRVAVDLTSDRPTALLKEVRANVMGELG